MRLADESHLNPTVRRLQRLLNGWVPRPFWDRETKVLRDGLLLAYSGAIGFVCAGISASFFKMVTSQPARFALLGDGWLGLATTFVFFGLTGPAIIMEQACQRRLSDRTTIGLFAGSVVIAGLWSACSGILVLGLMVTLGAYVA